jgi:hypothetical protein
MIPVLPRREEFLMSMSQAHPRKRVSTHMKRTAAAVVEAHKRKKSTRFPVFPRKRTKTRFSRSPRASRDPARSQLGEWEALRCGQCSHWQEKYVMEDTSPLLFPAHRPRAAESHRSIFTGGQSADANERARAVRYVTPGGTRPS